MIFSNALINHNLLLLHIIISSGREPPAAAHHNLQPACHFLTKAFLYLQEFSNRKKGNRSNSSSNVMYAKHSRICQGVKFWTDLIWIVPIYRWNRPKLVEIDWISKSGPGQIHQISPRSSDFVNPMSDLYQHGYRAKTCSKPLKD
jgi:hypothetical protein